MRGDLLMVEAVMLFAWKRNRLFCFLPITGTLNIGNMQHTFLNSNVKGSLPVVVKVVLLIMLLVGVLPSMVLLKLLLLLPVVLLKLMRLLVVWVLLRNLPLFLVACAL